MLFNSLFTSFYTLFLLLKKLPDSKETTKKPQNLRELSFYIQNVFCVWQFPIARGLLGKSSADDSSLTCYLLSFRELV